MYNRLAQEAKIDSIISLISSATSTPHWVSMENAEKACFIVSMGTAVGGLSPALSVLQSANTTSAGAAIAGATAVLGSSSALTVSNAKEALITISSASTDTNTITINGTTYTQSTANSATALQFGSTAGTTAAGGLDAIANALSSRINANQSSIVTATTDTTAAVRLKLVDGASTGVLNISVSANHTPTYERSQAIIEITAADLDSTSKYVALQLGTVATSIRANVTIIRTGYRYQPPAGQGPLTITS